MRVLHVIRGVDSRIGGPQVALAGLAPALMRAGIEVRILAATRAGDDNRAAERLRDQGARVELVGPCRTPLMLHPRLAPALRELSDGVDVVHVHGLWEQAQHLAAREARRRAIPYLFRPCGMLSSWSLAQSRLRKRLYLALRLRADLDRAAAIHCLSPKEEAEIAGLRLRPPVIIEPNGIDDSEFGELPPAGAFRGRYPVIGSRPLVLFLGRLDPKKGLDLLVPALAATEVKDAVLAIAGPDEQGCRRATEALVRAQEIRDRVVFTGMLRGRERIEALADADLFALPSNHENFGVVVIEALAAGTPVLVSDRVALCREIAAAGVGETVPLSVEPLAAALTRWLRDDAMRKAAAARARPFALATWSWNRIAKSWLGHYASLAARAAAPEREPEPAP